MVKTCLPQHWKSAIAACLLDLECLKIKVRYPYVKYTFGYVFQFAYY